VAIGTNARVLIVADDLTGALDTAGAFAGQGINTKVVAQPVASDPESVRNAQVVAVNTASRHLSAADAVQHVQQCTRLLAEQHFDIVYKKIDSTLRGNVVAETMALMDVCERPSALVAPAFPAQGRTVVDGVVHVEGVPLADTGFARDALSPPPLAPLGEVFAQATGAGQVMAWQHGQPLPHPDAGVVIADAESDGEMAELFQKVVDRADETMLVGSAGLGEMLAAHLDGANEGAGALTAVSGPIVFLVGSRAARSREQVEQLRREPQTVVIEAPNGVAGAITDGAGAEQIVLLAVDDPENGKAGAEEVAHRMAQAGLELAAFMRAKAMVVTGGDTAIAVLEESGCTVIDVCGNLMPGIPFSQFEWKGRPIHLVTKAGGFGTANTFVDIARTFRTGAAS
jgi:uncharacterized protein YgbK (DUF1537 family)